MKIEDEMDYIEWDKYPDASIDFILKEGEKLINETFSAYRELTKNSFWLLAFYIGVLSFCVSKTLSATYFLQGLPFIICFAGGVFSVFVLHTNIFPDSMIAAGAKPIDLTGEFYENEIDPLRWQKISRINAYNQGAYENTIVLERMAKNFKCSVVLFSAIVVISIITHYLILGL